MAGDSKLKVKKTSDLTHDLLKISGLEIDGESLRGVKPLYHSSDVTSRLREDNGELECFTEEEALSNAKVKKDGYFLTLKTF